MVLILFAFFFLAKNKLTESLSKEFFKNQISFINSDYGNSRHVSYRCNLDAGRYLLMATTYEPGEESGTIISILYFIIIFIFFLFAYYFVDFVKVLQ